MRPILTVAVLCCTALTANADQVVSCTNDDNSSKTTFLIKGPKDTPSQILWPWSGSLRTFAVKEYSDVHYMAIEEEPEREDSPGKMYINRLDGKVVLENYISHEAREVLVRLCDGEITEDACKKEQEGLLGGDLSACSLLKKETNCGPWRNGSNLLSKFSYRCVRGQRSF
jgi:hypothetical protein